MKSTHSGSPPGFAFFEANEAATPWGRPGFMINVRAHNGFGAVFGGDVGPGEGGGGRGGRGPGNSRGQGWGV